MPPAALSLKIGTDYSEMSRGLNQATQQFTRFTGQINRGAAAITQNFSGVAGATGKLGQSFNVAGQAASMFAGLNGIAGIATSLAIGGPVMGGLAALALAVALIGKSAREAKEEIEKFDKALGDLTKKELRANVAVIEEQVNALKAVKKAAEDARDAKIQESGAGREGFGGKMVPVAVTEGRIIDRTAQQLRDMEARLAAAKARLAEEERLAERARIKKAEADAEAKAAFLASPEGQRKVFMERLELIGRTGKALEQARALGQSSNAIMDLYAAHWQEVSSLADRYKGQVGEIANAVRQLVIEMKKVPIFDERLMANLKGVGSMVNILTSGGFAPSVTPTGPGQPNINQVRIGDLVAPAPRTAEIPGPKIDRVREAIERGFAELPSALGAVLGSLLGGLFGGNNRGAQIGGALGSAVGGGIGASLGGGVGSVIGSAILPVAGTLLGGVIGGAIGSLFGGAKKKVDHYQIAMDRLASTTERVNEAFTNLPTGIKVALQRYRAALPPSQNLPQPPGTPPIGGPLPPGGPIRPVVFTIGTLILNDVKNVRDTLAQLGVDAQRSAARGGIGPLRVAMAAGTL